METTKKVWIIGASGKHGQYGQYMVRHALDRGYEVVGVCWPQSAGKLDAFDGRIPLVPGRANDPTVIAEVVAGCDGALTVRVPRGVDRYATGTAQAVLGHAKPGARLTFSCGWPITIRTLPFRMRTRRERSGVSVRLSYAFRPFSLRVLDTQCFPRSTNGRPAFFPQRTFWC